ncbi:Nucleotid-trans domain-containing protein [Aphelenchoides besseyi]|nr:Nucleotid-trans domain-containing protein [Aphelenchoides besseyi]
MLFSYDPKHSDDNLCHSLTIEMLKVKRVARLILFAIIFYCLFGLVAYIGNLLQIPNEPRDFGFQKKNYDGPLVLRDEVLDEEYKLPNGVNIIKKAVLMESILQLPQFIDPNDVVIKEYNSSALKSLDVDGKLLKEIRSKAKVINKKHGLVLYTLINNAYLNLTLNWLCNTYVLDNGQSIHERVLIVALDEQTCKRITKDWPKVTCLAMTADEAYGKALDWGSSGYSQILWARIRQIYALVEAGIHLAIFETDALWLKNPLPLFRKSFNLTTIDLTIPKNYKETNGQKYAFDPMIIRPTLASKSVLKDIMERVQNNSKLMDQDILNEKCASGYLKCNAFEWNDVADGKWFKMSTKERNKIKPLIVNNNYYIGARSKMNRQALNNAWFLSPSLICNSSKAKKVVS